jgi:dihydroorotase
VAVSDDGKPVYNAQLMRRALEYCAMLGMPIVAHEEDANLNEGGVMHEGYFSTILGMAGIPAASEETMVARDVILAALTKSHVHIAHLSTSGAIAAVRNARQAGVRVTCEVTPHHIALGDDAVQTFSTNLKMNPPLRSTEHREALLEAIADGTIDAIATDHAPHHFDEKNVEFDLAPFGVIGLETAFGVCYDRLVREKVIALPRLIDLLSCGPARTFSLPGGTLKDGALGDVTILDLDTRYAVTNTFASKASNSPFIGETLHGRAVMTIVGGAVKFDIRPFGDAQGRPGSAPAKTPAKAPAKATKKSKR